MKAKKNKHLVLRESELRKMKAQANTEAVYMALVMFFTVLYEEFEFDTEKMNEVYGCIGRLSEAISEERVSYADLDRVLIDEMGVKIVRPRR